MNRLRHIRTAFATAAALAAITLIAHAAV